MDRIFEPRGYFQVPDGTQVSAFLNATDVTQEDLPWDLLGEMSIAAGRIDPGVKSWIHAHPLLTQVTYVVAGPLTVWTQSPGETSPRRVDLSSDQAVVTEPGAYFQLSNEGASAAEVLYITSPSYLFEMEGDAVVYDDAVLVARSWEEMASEEFTPPDLDPDSIAPSRRAAQERLRNRKRP